MGRRQESIETMKRVVNLDPDHADALNYLGYTYAEMGIHLDEAEQLIRSALQNKPENGYITDSMGWVYYKQGEYAKALTELLKAFQNLPDDPTIAEHIGDVYAALNENSKAIEYYNKALGLEKKEDKKKQVEEKKKSLEERLK